jgi:hypothetical protein
MQLGVTVHPISQNYKIEMSNPALALFKKHANIRWVTATDTTNILQVLNFCGILFKSCGKTHFQFTKRLYLRIVIFRQTVHYHGI